jgi:asparagine synthase (glutamine-hydrolysing)
MSGIAGSVSHDGAPVDDTFVSRLTESMAYRGPDALHVWIDGTVGLGHALLRTSDDDAGLQPSTLDQRAWITADVRVDARADLIAKLQSKGSAASSASTDAELILRAYRIWGDSCVEHLLGDFAFAIWDAGRQRLFCARDHFGVKPFYYAQLGTGLVFSNTLDTMRMALTETKGLNDQAIGDFLLFGFNRDLGTTPFVGIRRLRPGHRLTWAVGKLKEERYWELPVEEEIHYGREQEYVEQFRELLQAAVDDRLRSCRAGIRMSGGLDSGSVAATAARVANRRPSLVELRAYTAVYDKLIPDEERFYSGLTANALGIPVSYLAMDGYDLFERWDLPELRRPEPILSPLQAIDTDILQKAAMHSRILLTGEGGDPAFSCRLSSHFRGMIGRMHFRRLGTDLARFLMAERRTSRLYVRRRLHNWLRTRNGQASYPVWLNADLARQMDLPARWAESGCVAVPFDAIRPAAYEMLGSSEWPAYFEGADPGVSRLPIELRHPLLDLRVVRYLLRLPAIPWCSDKELLRIAMREVLPEPVRLRPKTPLKGDPERILSQRQQAAWVDEFEPVAELRNYVDRKRIPRLLGERDITQFWINIRPICLNLWLQHSAPATTEVRSETSVDSEYA